MHLIGIVRGFVGKHKRQRKIVRMVDNGSACIGGGANISRRNLSNAFQRFKTSAERSVIFLIFGMRKPEENCMDKHVGWGYVRVRSAHKLKHVCSGNPEKLVELLQLLHQHPKIFRVGRHKRLLVAIEQGKRERMGVQGHPLN